MISFYPGPSQVYRQVPKWIKKAYAEGFLSANHRSAQFEALMSQTQALLRENLRIPGDYHCYFTSSATECWEIIAQSLVVSKSAHLFNGAFGRKWYQYTKKLNPNSQEYVFDSNMVLSPELLTASHGADLIAITQNETSNGTQVSPGNLKLMREEFPEPLIALDVTSSMGGIDLPWEFGDVWFSSVQKCLGLPAGMGLLICSPRCLQRAEEIGDHQHYNSLLHLDFHMKNHQTAYTPNVLNIYLLNKVLRKTRSIKSTQKKVELRYKKWMDYLRTLHSLDHLIDNPEARSHTVIALKGDPTQIQNIIDCSKENEIEIGRGYGDLKSTTLRLANFPALRAKHIKALQKFWTKMRY